MTKSNLVALQNFKILKYVNYQVSKVTQSSFPILGSKKYSYKQRNDKERAGYSFLRDYSRVLNMEDHSNLNYLKHGNLPEMQSIGYSQ